MKGVRNAAPVTKLKENHGVQPRTPRQWNHSSLTSVKKPRSEPSLIRPKITLKTKTAWAATLMALRKKGATPLMHPNDNWQLLAVNPAMVRAESTAAITVRVGKRLRNQARPRHANGWLTEVKITTLKKAAMPVT